MQIQLPEVGYTPNNLTSLLYQALPDMKARREFLADKLGVSLDTIHRWCVDDSRRHVDMPLHRWRQALNLFEADEEVMKMYLRKAILATVENENLVFVPGHDDEPHLRCFYIGGGQWDISLGSAPGNAYTTEDNECFIAVGIESDSIDYSDSDEADNIENGGEWTAEDDELVSSGSWVQERTDEWVGDIFATIGPDGDDEGGVIVRVSKEEARQVIANANPLMRIAVERSSNSGNS